MNSVPDPSKPYQALGRVISGLTDYLAYQKDQGLEYVERRESRPPGPTPGGVQITPSPGPATPPPSRAASPGDDKTKALRGISDRVATCSRCHLCQQRTHTVPGQGNPAPEILFVGEGPGAEEDRQGLAFVGRAGKLLTQMIKAMGLTREEVFIGNIVKCRPPGNRVPTPDEMEACMPYLREQIQILKPRVIVALGSTAVKGLLHCTSGITRLRGTWMSFDGIDLMPTFHPAYLLRDPSKKKDAWDDLQEVLRRLGREAPPVNG